MPYCFRHFPFLLSIRYWIVYLVALRLDYPGGQEPQAVALLHHPMDSKTDTYISTSTIYREPAAAANWVLNLSGCG
jgi:hypothetical protein